MNGTQSTIHVKCTFYFQSVLISGKRRRIRIAIDKSEKKTGLYDNLCLQVADLMRSDDDTAESTGIFDDSDRIHLLKTLIHDARPTDVCESCAEETL